MQWLNNPWVIGIGGGILSGILVTLVSRFLFEKRDNKEYAQKVAGVNREILYAIRPSIPEGALPSLDVVESLISSTARRYGVDRKDVYGPTAIADELIKEVMDSSFISSKIKAEFCNSIASFKTPDLRTTLLTEVGEVRDTQTAVAQYRQRMVMMMSVMLGIVTTLMTLFYTVLREAPERKVSGQLELFLPMVATLMTAFAVTFAAYMRRIDQGRRFLKEESKKPNSEKT